MSIVAATADELEARGITTTDDLTKLVPGFSFQKSNYGVPVYFIRGVGFFDTTLGVSPAVTVYIDQLPLPYSPMSRGAILDLERVEVLKGPQGTLFGQNSTGGAVNYIAAKPTSTLEAGFNLNVGRFSQVDAEAYLSGPLSETISGRIAVRREYRDDWQYGYVNGDEIGEVDFVNARALIDINPSENLRFGLMASYWRDRSDTQQPQFIGYDPQQVPPAARPQPFPVATFPFAPDDARAASWDPNKSFARDNRFYQFGLRAEADLTDSILVTSLTSYVDYETFLPQDFDSTIYPVQGTKLNGSITSLAQELRLSGDGSPLRWMIGASYQKDEVDEKLAIDPAGSTSAHIGPFIYDSYFLDNLQEVETVSVFGSLDYALTDTITLQASGRYTDQKRDFAGCARDSGAGDFAAAFEALAGLVSGSPQSISPGDCVTFDANGVPLPIVEKELDEDNFAWRASINFKPSSETLLYANLTKGYKAGSFPTLPAAFETQLVPVPQESILAYEAGFKTSLFNRSVVLEGAGFYYDYEDKQLIGNRKIAPFGNLPSLVSIPKSRVIGVELSANAEPVEGLTFSVGGTYLDTKILRNPPNPTGLFGDPANFEGQSFPFTPNWQVVADVQYRFPVSDTLFGFFGGSVTAKSETQSTLFAGNPKEEQLRLPAFTLVDARIGVETADRNLRFELWGRNITDELYFTNAVKSSDFVFRFTGFPATYGATLRYRFGR